MEWDISFQHEFHARFGQSLFASIQIVSGCCHDRFNSKVKHPEKPIENQKWTKSVNRFVWRWFFFSMLRHLPSRPLREYTEPQIMSLCSVSGLKHFDNWLSIYSISASCRALILVRQFWSIMFLAIWRSFWSSYLRWYLHVSWCLRLKLHLFLSRSYVRSLDFVEHALPTKCTIDYHRSWILFYED